MTSIKDKDMKDNDDAYSRRRHRLCLALCLLLIQPFAQAGSNQLKMALMQTEATLRSLDQDDIQGAVAHVEAARSHVDIATRDAAGNILKDLMGCKIKLQETQRQAERNNTDKSKAAAIRARDDLKKLARN
jgi:hypothetical protein